MNKRLEKAMDDLKEKHKTGTNEQDDPDRAPTGDPYQRHQAEMQRRRREAKTIAERQREEESREIQLKKMQVSAMQQHDDSEIDDSDEEFLKEFEDNVDPELERIRAQRIEALRTKQTELIENKAKGHGEYRTIFQDDFLPECTGSKYVAVHFFHNEFQRCKIMDFHLERIAPKHLKCKFVRIDAEKTPFFVSKLQIQTLPTLVVFDNGKAIKRLTGFDGLVIDPKEPDKWHTGKLQEWLAGTGAIDYKRPAGEVLEEMRRLGIKQYGAIWSNDEYNDDDFE